MSHFFATAYIVYLHIFLDHFYKEKRNVYRMSDLKKPTDKAADLAEVICPLKGLTKYTVSSLYTV